MSELVRRRARSVLGILVITAVGCDSLLGAELNPAFCRAHPDDRECGQVQLPPDAALDAPDAAPDGPMVCTGNAECMQSDGTGVCDLSGSKMCVQCTESDDPCATAIPAKPVCMAKQCHECTDHAQCKASNVCLPGGRCADVTTVAYVTPNATDGDCSKALPCGTLAQALATLRPIVRIAAGTLLEGGTSTIERALMIFGETGAKLDRTGDGAILDVRNDNADVQIFDLEITGATGSPSDAAVVLQGTGGQKLTLTRVAVADNQRLGISVTAGTLIMSRCTVQLNLSGGIHVNVGQSTFDISDSFIVYNGTALGAASDVGGAALIPNTSGSRFERNTVAFNQSNGLTFRAGVSCNGTMPLAGGNLIYRNFEPDGSGGLKSDDGTQRGGACQFGNSLVIPSDPGSLGFKSPLTKPYDFHLTSASPATVVDAAGVCSGVDFDGDARPINGVCDFGADEYHP